MFFKKSYHWVEIVLWIGVILALIGLGYALWDGYTYGAIAAGIIVAVLLLFLGYYKYTRLMAFRRKFVIVQESFTTAMLVYFSYVYFSGAKKMPGEQALNDTRKKFDEVYEKSRYRLAMPLIKGALNTIGEIKNIKDTIMSEVKDFSSNDGFNLDNAESITKEIGNLIQKLTQLADIVSDGFSGKKTLVDIAREEPKRREKTAQKGNPETKSRAKNNRSKRTVKA